MSAGDTFRTDLRAGLKAVLDAYTAAAHAFELTATLAERPESYARPTPFAFVSLGTERIGHDSGTRTRSIPASIVLVDRITSNDDSTTRLDPIVDALLLTLSQNPHLTAESVWSDLTIRDDTDADGESRFRTVTFDFGDVTVRDGRP